MELELNIYNRRLSYRIMEGAAVFNMVTGVLTLDVILKEIDIKRQELNALVHNDTEYHSGVILDKSQELDRLIAEFYEKKQRE